MELGAKRTGQHGPPRARVVLRHVALAQRAPAVHAPADGDRVAQEEQPPFTAPRRGAAVDGGAAVDEQPAEGGSAERRAPLAVRLCAACLCQLEEHDAAARARQPGEELVGLAIGGGLRTE
eukprot:5978991-Prymnesium_polylepis.1